MSPFKKDNSGLKEQLTIINMSRRGFVKLAAVAAGSTFILGVFPGCELNNKPTPKLKIPAQGTMEEAGFQPNVFIAINENGDVFIVCSRSEMGQGIRTGMPAVIADELEADWNRVHVLQADGDPKYGNQNTDGSRSVRNNFDDWRKAGATARAMLIMAAADTWGVEASECVAENNKVKHEASGRELGYGALAASAATLDVPENVEVKPRHKWRYITKPISGIDNRKIATGAAVFGMDANLPGMLFASVERCPVIGGKIKTFDADAALAVPGVRQVVTIPAATLPPAFNALGGLAVVADNTWAAIKGREALKIDWDWGSNVTFNSKNHREEMEKSVTSEAREIRTIGKVEEAIKSASQTVETTYHIPMLAHAPMEPPNALAWVKEDGSCEVWTSTQTPQSARKTVAQTLGTDQEKVTVHVLLLGGGFGRKSKPDYVAEAALVSKETGTPIKLTWTREDEIRFDYFHAPSVQYLKAALDNRGRTTAWLQRTSFPSISSTFSPNVDHASNGELGLGFTTIPYNIPNIRLENGLAKAHVRIGWLRSVCNIQHGFAVNAFAGQLAYAAGRDQKEYLLELIGPPRNLNSIFEGDKGAYGENLERHPYETGRLRKVVELAAEMAEWDKDLPEGHALGIAAHFSFVSYIAHVVHASVKDGNVKIHRVFSVIDCGTYVNPDRVKSQMEGSVIFGLTLALYGNITAVNGAVQQSNFHDYPLLRINETPEITVKIVENEAAPGGVGEPGLPPVAPALANAILKITGEPVRELPIKL